MLVSPIGIRLRFPGAAAIRCALVLALSGTAALGFCRAPQNEASLVAFDALAETFLDPDETKRRGETLDQMLQIAWEDRIARARLKETLEKAWRQSIESLADPDCAKTFTSLRKAHERVETLRAQALRLIRDRGNYPYPFRSPDAPPEVVERYRESQGAIDRLLKALAKEWKKSPKVRYPSSVRSARAMLMLVAETAERLSEETRMTFSLSLRGAPGWMLALPSPGEVEGDRLTLASFGDSFEEGKELAESRAVVAMNAALREARVKGTQRGKERRAVERVFEQVRVTNRYRQLLGLRALAWRPELQEAASGHARYLDESGEFTHFQPTEELKDFTARAKTAGYVGKVYENCQRGANSAEEALKSLCRSTEHHRNLTTERLSEMAVGNHGRVWVQNFGTGQSFREGLEVGAWWRMEE